MKTKVIFLYIGLFVFLSNAFAQTVEIDGIAYSLSSNRTASVTSKTSKYSGDITIPSTITYNGINYSVTSIGYHAFYWCESLTSITIPNSVTSIGDHAFYYCSGLSSITIPNSVTSISDDAFAGCTGLTSIIVESGNSMYDSRNNCNAIIETSTNNLIAGCKNTIIPNSVTSIGDWAFAECYDLTSITIPNSVTSIGEDAFIECYDLTSITIPNSVTSIGDHAFSDCGLTSITIPNSVTSIGDGAFSFCSGLTSIIVESGNSMYDSRNNCNAIIETSTNNLIAGCKNTIIPNIVTSIGNYAFSGCIGLSSITIPNSVTSIGNYAFCSCIGLSSITIPNSVTSIGSGAFRACQGLTSITIPNSVTSIGTEAFSFCRGLSSITIPNSVTYMGTKVFPDHGQLSYILVDNPTPPIVSQTSSYPTSFYNGVNLYVPARSINAYRNASFWGNFQNINPLPSVTVHADHGDATISYLSPTDVEVVITPHYGYHFTQWSDGNTDNPRSVVLTQDTAFTATVSNLYQLSASSEHGTITGAGEYAYGSSVMLAVIPDTGYKFLRWSDGNTENPRSVVLTQDTAFTATVSNLYQLSASSEHATITGAGEYAYGSSVMLAVIPDTGYKFLRWSDGNTENPRSVVLTQDTAFTATVSNQYVLSGVSEHGTITGAGEYPYGSYVMLAVIPDNGYKFVRWSDGTIYNPYSLVLEKDFSVEAVMEPVASEVDEHESEDHSAKKIMKDGVIYIIKNGRTYNLYGTLIEGTE